MRPQENYRHYRRYSCFRFYWKWHWQDPGRLFEVHISEHSPFFSPQEAPATMQSSHALFLKRFESTLCDAPGVCAPHHDMGSHLMLGRPSRACHNNDFPSLRTASQGETEGRHGGCQCGSDVAVALSRRSRNRCAPLHCRCLQARYGGSGGLVFWNRFAFFVD